MALTPSLTLTQKQQLKLTPQLIQSFELMTLPLAELQQRIKEEIATNPALEIPSTRELSYENVADRKAESERLRVDDSYSDSPSYGYDEEATERAHRALEQVFQTEETLTDHLIAQLRLEKLSEEEFEMGMRIITNLDSNGFFIHDPTFLIADEQQELHDKMLSIIHTFDPIGVGVSSWRESLIVQGRYQGLKDDELEHFSELVRDNLELMRANKSEQVAKRIGISIEELDELYAFLKTLTPFPGQGFASGPQHYVIPDLSIRVEDGALALTMNELALPDLRINPEFEALKGDKEAKAYIQEQIKKANDLIFQLDIRNKTLYKVALVLLREQREFFILGPQYIKPLTQKAVAAEIGVHETTVSRIATAKWIDTDFGIIPLKRLFSSAMGDLSKEAVKETIRQILEEQEGQKALSDQKIADLLGERGIKIARRTVAKYRNELNIDPSFIRGTD
ncbi:MAG: RNA polymerase factor sigma-54 [Sphaerochaeta sp.]